MWYLTHCYSWFSDATCWRLLSLHQTSEADVEGKIFLGGLTWQTTEEMLKTHFGKWGTLNDVILMRNKITGEPRGFGFVQFQDSSCGFGLPTCTVDAVYRTRQNVPLCKRLLSREDIQIALRTIVVLSLLQLVKIANPNTGHHFYFLLSRALPVRTQHGWFAVLLPMPCDFTTRCELNLIDHSGTSLEGWYVEVSFAQSTGQQPGWSTAR